MKNLFFGLAAIWLFSLSSCTKDSQNELITSDNQTDFAAVSNSDEASTDEKQDAQPFASYTTVNGQVVHSSSGSINSGSWKGFAISKAYIQANGGEIAVLLQTFNGDADLYIYSNNYRLIKYSTQGGTSSELLYLKSSDLMSSESKAYIFTHGYNTSQYKIEVYKLNGNGGNTGGGNANTPFPETVIKHSNSQSPFATTDNVFNDDAGDWGQSLDGQCTWYTYGRVIELADGGHINSSEATKLRNALCCVGDRHAKNWPSKLGGSWISTSNSVLPQNKRKKGMIIVWRSPNNSSNPDPYGHVGFVEEVSSDKKRYKVSNFNVTGNENYSTRWYDFDGNDKIGLSGGRISDYPMFYELD